ncbi:MAG: hypothetical protein ABI678_25780 [Kofleriaceae bacterium]
MTRLIWFAFLVGCAASTPAPRATTGSTSSSMATLAGRRAQLVGWLHDYRMAGVFPKDGGGRPASVFVDANGVRCPMAELVYRSGRADLVEAVQRENNAVRLADVHAGALFDWMLASGLTQEEIAMVQGAMNIEYGNNFLILGGDAQQLAVEQAEVRGQLQMAEAALRQATGASLAIAAERLPTADVRSLAATPIGDHQLLAVAHVN